MYGKAKLSTKIVVVRQLVTTGMLDLAMVLVGYKNNDNRLRVWGRVVEWIVCYSGLNHLHQRILSAIHQFFESEP